MPQAFLQYLQTVFLGKIYFTIEMKKKSKKTSNSKALSFNYLRKKVHFYSKKLGLFSIQVLLVKKKGLYLQTFSERRRDG